MFNNLITFVFSSISSITIYSVVLSLFIVTAVLFIIKSRNNVCNLVNIVGYKYAEPEPQQEQQQPVKTSVTKTSVTKSSVTKTSVTKTSTKSNPPAPASKTSKAPQKAKKKATEPVFNTKLSAPIEDVIKETIKEELKSKNSQPPTSKKKEKPKTIVTKQEVGQSKKSNLNKEKDEDSDSIGYSFFKVPESAKTEKVPKKSVPNKPKVSTSQVSKPIEADSTVKDTSSSLVKDKSGAIKKKVVQETKTTKETLNSAIEQNQKKSKDSTSKPAIIDHYKKDTKQISSTTSTLSTKPANLVEKNQKLTVSKSSEEKVQVEDRTKTELKESKKVSSTISYANVVTNKIPEVADNLDININKLEEEIVEKVETISSTVDLDLNLDSQPPIEIEESQAQDIIPNSVNQSEEKETKRSFICGTIVPNGNDLVNTENSESETDTSNTTNSETIKFCSISDTNLENGIGLTSNEVSGSQLNKQILDKLSKSNSSSIEVINEQENNIEFQNDHFENIVDDSTVKEIIDDQTQFEIIEENLNKLVQSTDSDQFSNEKFCSSESSSIYVIENFIEPVDVIRETKEGLLPEPVLTHFVGGSTVESTFSNQDNEETKYASFESHSDDFFQSSAIEQICQNIREDFIEQEFNNLEQVEDICFSGIDDLQQEIEDFRVVQETINFTHLDTNFEKNNTRGSELDTVILNGQEITENPIEKQEILVENIQNDIPVVEAVENKPILDISGLEKRKELYKGNSESSLNHQPAILPDLSNNHEIVDIDPINLIDDRETLLCIQTDVENNIIPPKVSTITEDFLYIEKNGDLNIESEEKPIQENIPENDTNNSQPLAVSLIKEETSPQNTANSTVDDSSANRFDMASSQIRVLTLNNQEHQECTLYRIEKNWIIQFRLGPSLFGRKVYLYCNYPIENKGKLAEFNRDRYQLLNWALDEGCKNADDTAAYTQIVAKLAGSFHYYFTFEKRDNAERQGSGFFLVDPLLKYGKDEDLPLDCIQCQTVLAKSLGSFSTWEKKLQVGKESGYNMIHFTPIQALGISNSSYSLSEQLKLNPVFKKQNGQMPTFEEVKQFISKLRKDWKVTSICDIVLNHTANESEWIKVHPEVTYNCVNCPYMRPAYLLDAAFHQFSMDVKNGFFEDKGIPLEVNNEEHLNAIRYHFRKSMLDPLRIQELFTCDGSKLAAEFSNLARVTPPVNRNFNADQEELKILQDKEFRRLASTVDMKLALKLYNIYRNDTFDEESRLKRCTEEFKSKLDSLNGSIIEEINDHLTSAVENVIAGIRYFRVQHDGPRVKEITIKNPLVYRYFTDYGTPKSIKEHEEIMYSNNGRFLMAHNGWVMNSDPLKNFAAPDSNVYIRRELIAWGDSVKLRFGDKPEDCPFLWDHMKKYVELTAEIFDGVRLDNCHSTPIPVAEYLLDCARRVRPNLYVVAELFTNSDMTDNIFVNRLGITSLIREAMSAWDSHEEGRLVYRYGGNPVGSFYQPRVRPLVPSVAHALFLDLTHDNPSPVEKRSVFDLLPSTALVNMACCASGSNRGYDELVPHHIHVVDETREYTEWTEDEKLAKGNSRYVTKKSGIVSAKRAINDLHFTLGKEGYNQVYVDQMDPDIVAVTRHRPDTHQSYILVAFTAFGHPNQDAANYQRGIRPLRFEGVLDEIVLEATLSHDTTSSGGSKFGKWENFVKDSKWVNGLSEYHVTLKQHIQANESDILEKIDSGTQNVTQLNFKNFKPGSVVVVKTSLPESMRDAIKSVRTLIDQFSLRKETELSRVMEKLTLADLNRIIYRCGQEERDEGFGFDTYNIPNFGSLVYAGLQGFISLLANIRPNNDLGHPMCGNLRDGNWMIEYIWKRLKLDIGTKQLGQWIEENTKCFNNIPRYLVPSYFDVVVTGLYVLAVEQSYKLMSTFVNHGSTFVRGLSLGSLQFAAYIKSADLPGLSPNLAPPKPPTRTNDKGESVQACVTLSAGLPHFSVGYMRNWGRDTFIALRGMFILTGRFEEARQHILGYGACLRHGLIPNLLDGGRNSRFNCRDAVWWWLHCVKEYVEEAPNGVGILSDKVSRIFPTDDSPARSPGEVDQPLRDVMQEALKVHFQGLVFRERNAGRQIDEHMTDRGFNNQIGIHPETGFVFGGNEWNCGTWMDKMGSSDKAGNRGKPATPRDGSAIELIGLSKAVVTWLWKLSQEKKYPYKGVERTHKNGSVTKWTFKEWSDKIQANFEKYFWINETPASGEFKPNLINKRGIYKDCFGATQEWTDFQLRCNFPIAMVVAPELFTPQQAWTALKKAEKYLLGPLGMKTLDPEDWTYRADYDNSNDSEDPSVAHGFNYHQGPEWVWPVGFFLRAKLHFASLNGTLPETLASTKLVLSKHFTELQTSVWRGLPELTNSNGSYCGDSSRTQAWSMSCILEVLHDLQKIESNQPLLIN